MAIQRSLGQTKKKNIFSNVDEKMLLSCTDYWRACISTFDFSLLNTKNAPKSAFTVNYHDIINRGMIDSQHAGDEAFAVLCLVSSKQKISGRKKHPLFALPVKAQFEKEKLSPDAEKSILFNPEYLDEDTKYFNLGEPRTLSEKYAKAISKFTADETQANSWRSWWLCVSEFLQAALVDNNTHHLKQIFSDILNDDLSNAIQNAGASLELHLYRTNFAAVKPLKNIYESIARHYEHDSNDLVLYETLFREHTPTILIEKSSKHFARISAHMDEYDPEKQKRVLYPLDESQRLAVNAIVNLRIGQIQAVNGPPGSGKTSMLKAVIASNWVNAILENKPCPITVACGATNQSVTNVISAFGSIAHPNMDNPFLARWVPDVPSYGAYFPSQTKINEGAADKYFSFTSVFSGSFLFKFLGEKNALDPRQIGKNKAFYLSCANRAFNKEFNNIPDVMKALKKKIKSLNALCALSLDTPNIRKDTLQKLREHTEANKDSWDEDSRYKFANEKLSKFEDLSANMTLEDCQCLVDVVLRPELFHLAARYWEGQFILSQNELLLSKHPKNIEEALRRVCMLTPCLVSTLHLVGNLAAIFGGDSENGDNRSHIFGLFDLLIIDEAGQALPELGGAVFALAKRAATVGDLKQIAPVSSQNELSDHKLSRISFNDAQIKQHLISGRSTVNGSVLAMARKKSVFREPGDDGITLSYHYRCKPSIVEFCNQLSYGGHLVTRTSDDQHKSLLPAMAWVNVDAKAQKKDGSYQNKAEATEIAEWIVESWPAWQKHDDTKGKAIYEIVAVITPYKGQEKVLENALTKAFNLARKSAADESTIPSSEDVKSITVGTVHKLQGAERSFICFSLVEGPDKIAKSFVDKSQSIMNVAVSRAKKSFIIFANPKRLFPDQSVLDALNIKRLDTPVLFLGEYLKKDLKHSSFIRMLYPEYLVLIEAPGKKNALQKALGKKAIVLDTGGSFLEITKVEGFENGYIQENATLMPVFKRKREIDKKIDKKRRIEQTLAYVNECILATDDDSMGEYIAWQCLLAYAPLIQTKTISRVRLQATTLESIEQAFSKKSELDSLLVTAELLRNVTDFMVMKRCIELNKQALSPSSDKPSVSDLHELGVIYKEDQSSSDDVPFNLGRVQLAVLGVLYDEVKSNAKLKNLKKITVNIVSKKGSVKGVLGKRLVNGDVRYFSENAKLEDSLRLLNKASLIEQKTIPDYKEFMVVPVASTINILRACWAKHGITPDKAMKAMQSLYSGDWCNQSKLNELNLKKYQVVELAEFNEGGHPPIQPMLYLPPEQLAGLKKENIYEVYSVIWDMNEAAKNQDVFFAEHQIREYQVDKGSGLIVRIETTRLSEQAKKFAYLWGMNKYKLEHTEVNLNSLPEEIESIDLDWCIESASEWALSLDKLMQLMKDYGVGRPSTYHSLFKNLTDKKMIYVDLKEPVRMTSKGIDIINLFSQIAPNLCGPEFTRLVYEEMDEVREGVAAPKQFFEMMISRLLMDNLANPYAIEDIRLDKVWNSLENVFNFNIANGSLA